MSDYKEQIKHAEWMSDHYKYKNDDLWKFSRALLQANELLEEADRLIDDAGFSVELPKSICTKWVDDATTWLTKYKELRGE